MNDLRERPQVRDLITASDGLLTLCIFTAGWEPVTRSKFEGDRGVLLHSPLRLRLIQLSAQLREPMRIDHMDRELTVL